MFANNVGKSLALETRDLGVGMCKKRSLETSFNLQLPRSTHNIESEFKFEHVLLSVGVSFSARREYLQTWIPLKY
jgi:hypothetical protein